MHSSKLNSTKKFLNIRQFIAIFIKDSAAQIDIIKELAIPDLFLAHKEQISAEGALSCRQIRQLLLQLIADHLSKDHLPLRSTLSQTNLAALSSQEQGRLITDDADTLKSILKTNKVMLPNETIDLAALSRCLNETKENFAAVILDGNDPRFPQYNKPEIRPLITHLILPKTLKKISYQDIKGFDRLIEVIVSNGTEIIDESAFYSCIQLKKVTLPQGLARIGKRAFCQCHEMTEITIPDSVTEIGSEAFEGCAELRQMHIPISLTHIGDNTFRFCYELTNLKLPNTLTKIGNGAFSYCEGLKTITIPNSVVTIGDEAFAGCKNLCKVILPSSVQIIGTNAFAETHNELEIADTQSQHSSGFSNIAFGNT